ncbi:cupin domain-containing protein [Thermodesulfobacteriota bacterium]
MIQEIDENERRELPIDTYGKWLVQEGIPIIKDYSVSDIMAVPLKPWERKGGLGAFFRLVGAENVNDAYLCEIPPGATLKPQKHLYDELIYILSGMGATAIWNEGSPKQNFEWKEGSLFSPPLNTWHQHFNVQGDKPVRYIGVTLAPIFINLFHDLDFIFNNNYVFSKRFNNEKNYFNTTGRFLEERLWETNFVPDVRIFKLEENIARGGGGSTIRFATSDSVMEAHVSEFPVGTYKKAHRHTPGAHIIILSGKGYTLIWKEAQPRIRIDWKAGSLFVPPGWWFHQHFNTGKEPARYLALKVGEARKFKGILKDAQLRVSVKLGGDQIEYEDEDPDIRRMYKEELTKSGVEWHMSQYFKRE